LTEIRVLIADDHTLVRAGFRVLIETEDDMTVVGEAATGAETIRLARTTRPDVVLMDVRMPDVDGIEATREIVADDDLVGVRVLILTTFDDDESVRDGLLAGASGFLVKDTEPAELLHAIRVVHRGDALLSPGVTRRLIAQFVSRSGPVLQRSDLLGVLTEREREVVALAAGGLGNDEIAEVLVISPATVKTHVSHAMLKLGARDRAQLVAIAYQSRLITP
jgi:DNA-binding NarL/FixJ family response regulator